MGYHCKENLERCLPHMKNGQVHQHGQPVEEGEENELYKGLLIISNGKTLVDKLSNGGIINDDPEDLEFVTIQDKERFAAYLSGQRNKDGAYFFDGLNQQITRVGELNNSPAGLQERFKIYSMVPPNFLSADSSVPLRDMGTKTRLAVRMPLVDEKIHSYLIKRSGYAHTGTGKVAHFGSEGLVEEFFFEYRPEHNGSFISPEHKIVGVYRRWEREPKNIWHLLLEDLVADPATYFSRNK